MLVEMQGKAPDQNRTDTSSLEGYCSTIELQAQRTKYVIPVIFLQQLIFIRCDTVFSLNQLNS